MVLYNCTSKLTYIIDLHLAPFLPLKQPDLLEEFSDQLTLAAPEYDPLISLEALESIHDAELQVGPTRHVYNALNVHN